HSATTARAGCAACRRKGGRRCATSRSRSRACPRSAKTRAASSTSLLCRAGTFTSWRVRPLTRAAAPDLRALLAERRVGKRLERVVQRTELVHDRREMLCGVEPAVECP